MTPQIRGLKDFNKDRKKGPLLIQYTDDQAEGAIPNGTRVYKTNSTDGDATQDGQMGTVVGSIADRNHPNPDIADKIGYFVCWDHTPDIPCGVVNTRIAPLIEEEDECTK